MTTGMRRFGSHLALSGAISLACAVSACSARDATDDLPASTVESQAIIGGSNTSNETWPWSVRLSYNGELACGGSLIAPDWVLTVAHCLMKGPATGYAVLLGSGELISASEIIPHPDYVDDPTVSERFDVGLIHLQTSAIASSTVGFIRPALDGDAPGITATAIGWGMNNHFYNSPTFPGQLQQLSLPVVENSKCNNVLLKRNVLYAEELCAGFADGHAGVCFGDSGSPIMAERSPGVWEQIGMPSGVRVGDSLLLIPYVCNSFAIFTRISSMIGWIRQYVPDPAWFPSLNLITI
jgi:secreted trypsin-like serine protease